MAAMLDESIPPLNSRPTGLSLLSRNLTDDANSSLNSSAIPVRELISIGWGSCSGRAQYRRMSRVQDCRFSTKRCAGRSWKIPSKLVTSDVSKDRSKSDEYKYGRLGRLGMKGNVSNALISEVKQKNDLLM